MEIRCSIFGFCESIRWLRSNLLAHLHAEIRWRANGSMRWYANGSMRWCANGSIRWHANGSMRWRANVCSFRLLRENLAEGLRIQGVQRLLPTFARQRIDPLVRKRINASSRQRIDPFACQRIDALVRKRIANEIPTKVQRPFFLSAPTLRAWMNEAARSARRRWAMTLAPSSAQRSADGETSGSAQLAMPP